MAYLFLTQKFSSHIEMHNLRSDHFPCGNVRQIDRSRLQSCGQDGAIGSHRAEHTIPCGGCPGIHALVLITN